LLHEFRLRYSLVFSCY